MKAQLLRLMKELNLTATRFANKIGVQRSSISHILSGRNQPSFDFILKILEKVPDINAEWLITGRGDIFKSEKEIIDKKEEISEEKPIRKNDVLYEDKIGKTEKGIKSEMDTEKQIDKVTYVNNLEKIIVFYEDRTFVEYMPRQNG